MRFLKFTLCAFFLLGLTFIASAQVDTSAIVRQTGSDTNSVKQYAYYELAKLFLKDSAKREGYLAKILADTTSLADSTFSELVDRKISILNRTFQHEVAKQVAWKALARGKQKLDTAMLANAHKQLSASSYKLYDFDSTIYHLDEAIKYYKAINDLDNLGLMVLRQGGVYYAQGNYSQAIEKAFRASEIFKKTNKKKQLALSYMQLGNIYYLLRNYTESANYYELSADYYTLIGDSIGRAFSLSNLSLTKIKLDSFEVALKLQREIIPYILESGREISIGNSYYYFSEAFLGLKQLDSAERYHKKSNYYNRKTGYIVGQAYDMLIKARIEFHRQNLDSAIYYAQLGNKYIDTITSFEAESEISRFLATVYAQKKDYANSYKYLERYAEIRDSLDFDVSEIETLAHDHRSKLERTEYELKLAKQKEILSEEKSHYQQLLIVILSIVAVVALFFAGVLSSTNKKNKFLNKELQRKQELIEGELHTKRALLKEIHHRVKNNLQIISSMLSIQSQYLENEQMDDIIKECRSRIVSMSLIHESLYKREDNSSSLFSAYIKELMPQLVDTYHIDESKVHLEMDIQDLELSLDDSVPCGLIINEVVSNSLKHAFPDGKEGTIEVKMFKEADRVHLNISDNGVGFPKGVAPNNQDTFGFLLIYTLSTQLEAELEIDTANGVAYRINWESKDDKLLS